MHRRVILSVTNDLATDQRLKRFCKTLHEQGYQITLTGRKLPGSLSLDNLPWTTRRVKHWFNKGVLFYAEYNIRLFLFLLFSGYDILHSNDLDTLPANYLASVIRKKTLIYDSHEYFTEIPEIRDRKAVKKVWELIEKLIFPRLKNIITVSESIASEYGKKYGKNVNVIRNLPERIDTIQPVSPSLFGLPPNKKLVIIQGTGINMDRGASEAVQSMKYFDNAVLVIAGKGDLIPVLRKEATAYRLKDKVFFIPVLPYERLMQLTKICDVGLSLDKDTNLNYRYSLPNKLFDYIIAGIPSVVSPMPEVKKIVEDYHTGLVIEDYSPAGIAEKINILLYNKPKQYWHKHLEKAMAELNWENEKWKLLSVYENSVP